MKDDPQNVKPNQLDSDSPDLEQPNRDAADPGQPSHDSTDSSQPNQGHEPTEPGQPSLAHPAQKYESLDLEQDNPGSSDSDQSDQGHDSSDSDHLDPDQLDFGADYQVSPSPTGPDEPNNDGIFNDPRRWFKSLVLGAAFLGLAVITVLCVITARNANLRAKAAEQAQHEAEETLSRVADSLHLIESTELLSQSDFSTFSPDLLRWTDRYGTEHLMKCYSIRADDTYDTDSKNYWFTDDSTIYSTPSYDEIGEQIVYRETMGGSDHDKLIVESHQWLKSGNHVVSVERYYEEMNLPSDERYPANYANEHYTAKFSISDSEIPFRLDESDSITSASFTDDVVYQGPAPSKSPCGCLNCCCDDCTCEQ